MNRLIIKRAGNLLSVITDREITEAQTVIVESFIDMLEEATPAELKEITDIFSPPERLTGIEQYQAESR